MGNSSRHKREGERAKSFCLNKLISEAQIWFFRFKICCRRNSLSPSPSPPSLLFVETNWSGSRVIVPLSLSHPLSKCKNFVYVSFHFFSLSSPLPSRWRSWGARPNCHRMRSHWFSGRSYLTQTPPMVMAPARAFEFRRQRRSLIREREAAAGRRAVFLPQLLVAPNWIYWVGVASGDERSATRRFPVASPPRSRLIFNISESAVAVSDADRSSWFETRFFFASWSFHRCQETPVFEKKKHFDSKFEEKLKRDKTGKRIVRVFQTY